MCLVSAGLGISCCLVKCLCTLKKHSSACAMFSTSSSTLLHWFRKWEVAAEFEEIKQCISELKGRQQRGHSPGEGGTQHYACPLHDGSSKPRVIEATDCGRWRRKQRDKAQEQSPAGAWREGDGAHPLTMLQQQRHLGAVLCTAASGHLASWLNGSCVWCWRGKHYRCFWL